MSRNVVLVAIVALAAVVYVSGGHLGPFDLNRLPTPFLVFSVVSVLVVFGISLL